MNITERYYSIEDWSLAKWLKQTQHTLNHRHVDLVWATGVLSYFKTYIKIAKLYLRHYLPTWGDAIKWLWKEIRQFKTWTDINRLLVTARKRVLKHNRSTIERSSYARTRYRRDSDMIEFNHLQQRAGNPKFTRIIRSMKKTYFIANAFAAGIVVV